MWALHLIWRWARTTEHVALRALEQPYFTRSTREGWEFRNSKEHPYNVEANRAQWEAVGKTSWQGYDVQPTVPTIIMADTIKSSYNPQRDGSICDRPLHWMYDTQPLVALQSALIKRISSRLPSISLKTGSTTVDFDGTPLSHYSLRRSLDNCCHSVF